jgi:hypothetical protein
VSYRRVDAGAFIVILLEQAVDPSSIPGLGGFNGAT